MQKPSITLELWRGKQPIGRVHAVDRGTHDVVHVFVEPRYRRRGLGKALVVAAKDVALGAWKSKPRWRCLCARDLRIHDKPEHHAHFCPKRRKKTPP